MKPSSLMLIAACFLALCGCQEQVTVETPPPAEQKVVMVPSHKEGQPVPSTPQTSEASAAPAPLPPGSRPDGPQPGDADYKGGS
jgi:hypothetical protein